MEQIRFYNTGIQLKDNRTEVAGYLHGTQSFDHSTSIGLSDFVDIGRLSGPDFEKIATFSIDLERIIANYSTDSDYIFGPLLHHMFAISDTKFPIDTGPVSYKNSFLLSNLGHASTGNLPTDIKDFDLRLATKELQYTGPETPEFDLLFRKCLIKSIDYSIEVGGVLREKISLESKIRMNSSGPSFTKEIINLEETTPTNETIKLVRSYDYDKTNSVLPTFLNNLCNDSLVVDGSLVVGLKSINMSLNIDYSEPTDTGNVLGAVDNENVNLFKFIKVPLDISIKFTVSAQKEIPEILLKDANFGQSKIIIVFECPNTPNYLVFHLGKRNRLTSISKSGGSVSGDPVSYDFEYKNKNNDFCCYFTDNTNFSLIEESTEKF